MTGSEESPLQTWSAFPLLCAPGDALASAFSFQKTETQRGSFVRVGSRRPLQAPLFLSGGGTAVPLEAGGGSGLVAGGRGAGAGAAPPSELWLCEWGPIPPALSSYTALLSLQTPLLPVPSGAPGPQPPLHLSSRCTAALTGLALVGVPGRTWAEPEAWASGYLGQGGRHAPWRFPPASPAAAELTDWKHGFPRTLPFPLQRRAQLSVHVSIRGDPPPDPTVSLTPLTHLLGIAS